MLRKRTSWSTRALGAVIAIIQIVDIFIHVATNQVEPIRITSNIIILLWLAMVFIVRNVQIDFLKTAIGSIAAYLALNVTFLMLKGVTNPEQGGEPRVVLFVLVFLTTALSSLLTYLCAKNEST